MLFAVALLAITAILLVGWIATRTPSQDQFSNSVRSRLTELGLQVEALPAGIRSRLDLECNAVYGASKRFDPKRLAMRFFTWHVTEHQLADAALAPGPSVTNAILTLQTWQRRDNTLKSLAQDDINQLASS